MTPVWAALAAAGAAVAGGTAPEPRLVLHDGTLLSAAIEWETTIVFDEPVEGPRSMELAIPLPPEIEVAPAGARGGAVAFRDARGAVTGFELLPAGASGEHARTIVLRLRQPLQADAASGDAAIRLAAPLLAGRAPQGIALLGEAGARFSPDTRLGIEHRVGRLATHGFGFDTLNGLEAAERAMGRVPAPWRCWLVADSRLGDAGGLVGKLETGRPRRGVVVATGVGFLAVVALLGAGVRGLSRSARRERDDALLERELKRLRRSPE